MAHPPDPAGNFATDAHRRILTAVPNAEQGAKDTDAIIAWYNKISQDILELTGEEILSILEDLQADGDIEHNDDGWIMTDQGHDIATGPTARDGGRNYYE